MSNPDDDATTTVNVKSVSVRAWERAKICASREGQSMGAWLSGAIDARADQQAGPREFPPTHATIPFANPIQNLGNTMTPMELAAIMNGLAALATASGKPTSRAAASQANALADNMLRKARGLQPKALPRGKAERQSLLQNGQSRSIIEG